MNELEVRNKLEAFINQLSVEELEEKIAPIDCAKKPDHPDCLPRGAYGGPQPYYGGPAPAYAGPF